MQKEKTLVVLLGPTGVGKTELSLRLAEKLKSPIVSADSRQFYRELKIGTATPTDVQLKRVAHYFIANKSITETYSCGQYEIDALNLLSQLFLKNDVVFLVGGSMLYVDAVCKGIDDLPTIDPFVREEMQLLYKEKGLDFLRNQLKLVDPVYYKKVDLGNAKRIIHALEIYMMTKQPFSSFHKKTIKERPFHILKIGLNRDREELYGMINSRVDEMIKSGLENEVRGLLPYKEKNALNTVGYKELFKVFEGEWTIDFAIEKIKKNTRNYAKKQITWFKKDESVCWFHPSDYNAVENYLFQKLGESYNV
ncbi:MAG: tRNA (adenosine(37)-N6)-dimethylallyltransferase MiaA [Paludibacteraceae bacterium]|nr:tRNA (adenosine(37)-N6)-dimethylallyltransferase MiaA [Paludibacteraceae bacterium]